MSQTKVVLFCNADADGLYGDNGMFSRDYKRFVPEGELVFKGFAGYLDARRRVDFIREASEASVVVMDCWNYQEGLRDVDPYEQVAYMIRQIFILNPRVTLFVQLMEGRADQKSHKVPGVRIFDTWCEPQIKDEIMLAHRRAMGPLYRNLLLFDDTSVHLRFGAKQLSRSFKVWTAASWDEALRKLQFGDFLYLLSDLLVPASAENQGPGGAQYVGKEAPMGAILALLALSCCVRGIGVVTDKGHHDHPASAALDHFLGKPFCVGLAKLFLTNQPNLIPVDGETCEPVDRRENTLLAKDWAEIASKIVE